LELTPVNEDFTFGADKEDAAAVPMQYLHAIGVEVTQAFGRFRIFRRDDFHRPTFIHSQSPLGNIEVMGPPISHHAAGIFSIVAPIREMLVHSAWAQD